MRKFEHNDKDDSVYLTSEGIQYVCPLCNHNRAFHIFIREKQTYFCKVQNCRCERNVPKMMHYASDLLEQWR